MTNKRTKREPASVSQSTKQAGEIRDRWSWVEPDVWTDRMLTTLETGVKGSKWYSLIDKIIYAGRMLVLPNVGYSP